jgi:cytochrome b pre-mRNA-processing protein 3
MDQPPQPPSSARRAGGLAVWAERRRARRAHAEAAHRLYDEVVKQARTPRLYSELGVPDTPEGRFEMVALHAALLMRRLRAAGGPGRALGQALFDLMFADMDASMRELGVGDLGVGKQVQRLAGQFYARLAALDDAFGKDDMSALGPILRANVYHGGPAPSGEQVATLGEHLAALERHLATQSPVALLRGDASLAVGGGRSGAAFGQSD